MPDWLTKASTALGIRTAEPPPPLEFTCHCGNRFFIVRRTECQSKTCAQCGERWFILPLDVYPEPKPPPVARKKKNAKSRAAEGNGAVAEPWARVLGRRCRSGLKAAGTQLRQATTSLSRRTALGLRRLFTPLRVVALGIGIIVVATVVWRIHESRLEAARVVVRESEEQARRLLAEGDFVAAAAESAKAVEALQLLEWDDEHSRAIRQLHRESTAVANLSLGSLAEIVQDGQQTVAESGLEEWRLKFRSRYRGTWVILQATVFRSAPAGAPERFELDLPLSVGGQWVRIDADLPIFELVCRDGSSHEVIFAAPLEDCRPVPHVALPAVDLLDDDNHAVPRPTERPENTESWVIVLRRYPDDSSPVAAFLWTNLDLLERVGFLTDEAAEKARIEQLLREQAALLGVPWQGVDGEPPGVSP